MRALPTPTVVAPRTEEEALLEKPTFGLSALSPAEQLHNALIDVAPCEYSGLAFDDSKNLNIYLFGASDTLVKQASELGSAFFPDAPTVLVRAGQAARYVAEDLEAEVREYARANGIFPVSVVRNEAGGVTVGLWAGTGAGEAPVAPSVLLALRGAFAQEIEAGTLVVSDQLREQDSSNAHRFDWYPESGGQVRWINQGSGVGRCTSGPQLYNHVPGYGWTGTISGHCGYQGMGVFGGDYQGGNAQYLNPVYLECGWSAGTCYADIGLYQRTVVGGQVRFDQTYYPILEVGGTEGPAKNTTVCMQGDTSGMRCGLVTKNPDDYYDNGKYVPNGFRYQAVCADGDSRAAVFEFIPGGVRIHGSHTGSGSSGCFASEIYYIATSTQSAIAVY